MYMYTCYVIWCYQVPIVQVVERVVEVLKEVPIEVVKEVPVYVRTDVTDVEEHNRKKGHYTQVEILKIPLAAATSIDVLTFEVFHQAGPSFSQYTGGTQVLFV